MPAESAGDRAEAAVYRVPVPAVESPLAWLLEPLTVQAFLDEVWGARHYHIKRGCPGYFDNLLHGRSAANRFGLVTCPA